MSRVCESPARKPIKRQPRILTANVPYGYGCSQILCIHVASMYLEMEPRKPPIPTASNFIITTTFIFNTFNTLRTIINRVAYFMIEGVVNQ